MDTDRLPKRCPVLSAMSTESLVTELSLSQFDGDTADLRNEISVRYKTQAEVVKEWSDKDPVFAFWWKMRWMFTVETWIKTNTLCRIGIHEYSLSTITMNDAGEYVTEQEFCERCFTAKRVEGG